MLPSLCATDVCQPGGAVGRHIARVSRGDYDPYPRGVHHVWTRPTTEEQVCPGGSGVPGEVGLVRVRTQSVR